MNTADRSVEALDTALRRRFSFKEMRPDYTLLPTVEGVEVGKMLQTINARIELLLDKDHAIGHSYFLGLETIEDLRLAFENKLIPLLQEYFFGDFSKIGLVLGESFVALQKPAKDGFFAPFASVDKNLRNDLLRREVYHFTDKETWDSPAFQRIYS
jgi:5-methylcytosine-specific restriction protein B